MNTIKAAFTYAFISQPLHCEYYYDGFSGIEYCIFTYYDYQVNRIIALLSEIEDLYFFYQPLAVIEPSSQPASGQPKPRNRIQATGQPAAISRIALHLQAMTHVSQWMERCHELSLKITRDYWYSLLCIYYFTSLHHFLHTQRGPRFTENMSFFWWDTFSRTFLSHLISFVAFSY